MNLRSDDGHGEAGLVEAAGGAEAGLVGDLLTVVGTKAIGAKAVASLGVAAAERGVDVAGAGLDTITGQDGEGDEGTSEDDVQEHSEESEEADAAKERGQDDGGDGVDDGDTSNTLDGLLPVGNGTVAVGEDGQEVRVEAEDDGGTAEAEHVRDGPEQAIEETHGCGVVLREGRERVWVLRRGWQSVGMGQARGAGTRLICVTGRKMTQRSFTGATGDKTNLCCRILQVGAQIGKLDVIVWSSKEAGAKSWVAGFAIELDCGCGAAALFITPLSSLCRLCLLFYARLATVRQ